MAETTCGVVTTFISLPPAPPPGKDIKKIHSKVKFGKKGWRMGGRCSKIQVYFSLSYCNFICNNLNYFV